MGRKLILLAWGLLIVGCASNKPWASNYDSLTTKKYAPTAPSAIQFEEASYSVLTASRSLYGYEVIGCSNFRAGVLDVPPGAPGSSLREQAVRVGAHRVRWAQKSIGPVARTVMVPAPIAPALAPSSYDVTSDVYGPEGYSSVNSTIRPSGSGSDAFSRSFQQGFSQSYAASAAATPHTYYENMFDYCAVYYRRIGE